MQDKFLGSLFKDYIHILSLVAFFKSATDVCQGTRETSYGLVKAFRCLSFQVLEIFWD